MVFMGKEDLASADPSMSLLEGIFKDDWYIDFEVLRMFIQLYILSNFINNANSFLLLLIQHQNKIGRTKQKLN